MSTVRAGSRPCTSSTRAISPARPTTSASATESRSRSSRAAAARHYPHGDEELLAAKIVGRWRDGTPLSVSPDRPDAAIASDPARVNDFRYEDDPDGLACPLGAHIRRANPRDALGFEGRTVV